MEVEWKNKEKQIIKILLFFVETCPLDSVELPLNLALKLRKMQFFKTAKKHKTQPVFGGSIF